MYIMKNHEFEVKVRGLEIVIIQGDLLDADREHKIFIDVSQHAALVKGIGLAADEIYRKEKEDND